MTALEFTCPRCTQPVAGRFYGPCETCREQLRATMLGARRTVKTAAFEPKMNVVPNHVATKE